MKTLHYGYVSCKAGNVFLKTSQPNETDWLLEALYYQAQGCNVEISYENKKFSKCDCSHCEQLIHEFNEE